MVLSTNNPKPNILFIPLNETSYSGLNNLGFSVVDRVKCFIFRTTLPALRHGN